MAAGLRRGARGPLNQGHQGFLRPSLLDRDGKCNSDVSIFYSMENGPFTDLDSYCGSSTAIAVSNSSLQSAVDAVDWHAFEMWLRGRLSKKHSAGMLNYSKKWCHVLFGGRLSQIEGHSGQKHIMMALANLSKFLGCYSFFRKAKAEAGLKWKTRNGFDIFQKIYENEIGGIEEWVDRVVQTGDEVLSFPVVFMALSGLRVVEAVKSLNRIVNYGLDGYCKDGVLEHFRYPTEFLRKNKNAYVTIVPDRLLSLMEEWKRHLSYSMMVKRCRKYGLQVRFHALRKFFATTLRMSGIPSEIVDSLQGRVGGSVFVASYLRPNFMVDVVKKVKDLLAPYLEKWLYAEK